MKTYHVQVNTYGDPAGSFCGNAKVYDTETAAIDAAKDLFFRWTAVKFWRVIDSDNNVIASNQD